MKTIGIEGSYCVWPRQQYNPADLPAEYHPQVWSYFERAALRYFLPEARNQREREGMRERAQEAASVAYLFWRTNRTDRIPRGAHYSAMAGVRRFMEKSRWQGRKDARRASRRTVTAERIAARERLRARHNPTPESVAMTMDRIASVPAAGRKAYRFARQLGLPGVRELVRVANGFAQD